MFLDTTEDDNELFLACKASVDPDTLYCHEAMKEPDHKHFTDAMVRAIVDHYENGNSSVIHKSQVPKRQKIIPAVWQMRRKREILSGKIKKYKARLNIDGSCMQRVEHYDQTYSPVAHWNSIRLLLILTAIHNW